MGIDQSTGIWTPQDVNFWRTQELTSLQEHPTIDFNVSIGSNYWFEMTVHAEALTAVDANMGLLQKNTIIKFIESGIQIEASQSITPSGIRSAFLSLAPLVQKCSIIQATVDREDWYIFLELNKSFNDVTDIEKEQLLTMGSSRQGLGKLPSKYPEDGELAPPSPIVTIEGEGMIRGSYQEVGVYTILNEIQKNQVTKLLIAVIVLTGFEDSVHYTSDRLDILNDFKDNFVIIQGIKVDFVKIDYVPIIHDDTRKKWMYDFNFYDNTNPDNLLPKNHIVVNEYEYLSLGEDDPVKVSFYKQGTYNANGTYTQGDLIE